ncbi:hypothetical protein [Leptolyngbya sp. FACHB-261]|uniref:hypothetical protein n=1 Tax=Leptolyngbya sp. FACHB-261 TaxID=2692806 RepID=UPI001689A67C|nr:hypothetical protein [Leptolyngbya sp. FACHB-261]MBD2104465.1 hypothetical protein [Leptolyngbya sp. FACHB-261]
MRNINLDEQTEQQLADLVAYAQTDESSLLQSLIQERWLAMQPGRSVIERLGGLPRHRLEGPPNLSDPDVSLAHLDAHIQSQNPQ